MFLTILVGLAWAAPEPKAPWSQYSLGVVGEAPFEKDIQRGRLSLNGDIEVPIRPSLSLSFGARSGIGAHRFRIPQEFVEDISGEYSSREITDIREARLTIRDYFQSVGAGVVAYRGQFRFSTSAGADFSYHAITERTIESLEQWGMSLEPERCVRLNGSLEASAGVALSPQVSLSLEVGATVGNMVGRSTPIDTSGRLTQRLLWAPIPVLALEVGISAHVENETSPGADGYPSAELGISIRPGEH